MFVTINDMNRFVTDKEHPFQERIKAIAEINPMNTSYNYSFANGQKAVGKGLETHAYFRSNMWPSTNGSTTEIITYLEPTKNTELRGVNIPELDSFTSLIEEADGEKGIRLVLEAYRRWFGQPDLEKTISEKEDSQTEIKPLQLGTRTFYMCPDCKVNFKIDIRNSPHGHPELKCYKTYIFHISDQEPSSGRCRCPIDNSMDSSSIEGKRHRGASTERRKKEACILT